MEEKLHRILFMQKISEYFYNSRMNKLMDLFEQYNSIAPETRFLTSELCRLAEYEEKFYKFMKTFPGPIPDNENAISFFYDVIIGNTDF